MFYFDGVELSKCLLEFNFLRKCIFMFLLEFLFLKDVIIFFFVYYFDLEIIGVVIKV